MLEKLAECHVAQHQSRHLEEVSCSQPVGHRLRLQMFMGTEMIPLVLLLCRELYYSAGYIQKRWFHWLSLDELLEESVDMTSTSSFSLALVSMPTELWLLEMGGLMSPPICHEKD